MKFELDGTDISPKDWEDFTLKVVKNGLETDTTLSAENITLVNEGIDVFNSWATTKGRFKGIPFDVQLNNGTKYNYYVDPRTAVTQSYGIDVDVFRRYETFRFWEQVDPATFDVLQAKGANFTTSLIDYKVVPTDKATQSMLIVLAGFNAYNLITDITSDISRLVSMVANPLNVGAIIIATSAIVLKIVVLIIFLNKLFKKLKEVYFPDTKTLKTISYKNLITQGLSSMGFTLQSSIIDWFDDIHYIGVPVNRNSQSIFQILTSSNIEFTTLGYPTASDRVQGMTEDYTTLGGFLRYMQTRFNLKFIIKGTTVIMERRDTQIGTTANITAGLAIQSTRQVSSTMNTGDAWRKCVVRYSQDPIDQYSYDNFNDSIAEFETQNNDEATNSDLNLISGVKDVNMFFSWGTGKDGLNYYEKLIKEFLYDNLKLLIKVIEKVGSAFGGNSNTGFMSSFFNFTKDDGIMTISQNTFSRPKIVRLGANRRIKSDWKAKLGAEQIFTKWHEIDFIGNNDFEIHTGEITECTNEMFNDLGINDYADINNDICEVLAIEYNETRNTAVLNYKKPSNYANTVKLVKL